jgi:hypothetical protein
MTLSRGPVIAPCLLRCRWGCIILLSPIRKPVRDILARCPRHRATCSASCARCRTSIVWIPYCAAEAANIAVLGATKLEAYYCLVLPRWWPTTAWYHQAGSPRRNNSIASVAQESYSDHGGLANRIQRVVDRVGWLQPRVHWSVGGIVSS